MDSKHHFGSPNNPSITSPHEDLKASLSSNIKKLAVTDAADRIAKIALDLVK